MPREKPEPAGRDREPSPRSPGGAAEPMLYCPVCNSRLEGARCKLVCKTCGYYMSCADYY